MYLNAYIHHIAQLQFPAGYRLTSGTDVRELPLAESGEVKTLKAPDRAWVVVHERSVHVYRDEGSTPVALDADPAIVIQSDHYQESIESRLRLTAANEGFRYAYEDTAPVLHRGNIRHRCNIEGANVALRYVIHYILIEDIT